MKIVFKRMFAYLIDVVIVTLISTLLVSNKYINMQYEKYQKTYKEYIIENNNYESINNFLSDSYSNKKIEIKEYNKLDKYPIKYKIIIDKYYDDNEISKKEYDSIIKKIDEDYSKIQIDNNYKLIKYSIVPTIISILTILLYFVVFQFYFNGKTLGKKLMKLKVVSHTNKKLTIVNFLLRSLIVNEVFINILNIIFINILSKNSYILYNQIIYIITYILEMSIIFSILINKNNRGVHDYISNTKVIEDIKEQI